MGNILIVPVQVDALFVPTERMVVEATADFSRLPYTTPDVDVHPNNPYISEEILSKPFQNTNLNLAKGIHLHWTLPDALTRGYKDKDSKKAKFPVVPNRWLVKKKRGNIVVKEWVVLSDFLHPDGEGEGKVCIPFEPDPKNGFYQPFRFLGKTEPRELYDPTKESQITSYPDLTILGYGEPTFAAFYPNCHSVFGFHDPLSKSDKPELSPPDLKVSDLKELSYEVIGWYSDPAKDFLFKKLSEIENTKGLTEKEIKWNYILDELKWSLPTLEKLTEPKTGKRDISKFPIPPDEMICYASKEFKLNSMVGELKKDIKGAKTTVTVGITGTEAISAYLGHTLSSDQGAGDTEKRMIEEQMEALLMGSNCGKDLDAGARFRQYRHEKGFMAVEGGHYWILSKEGDFIINENSIDKEWKKNNEKSGLLKKLRKKIEVINTSWDNLRDKFLRPVNELHIKYDEARTEIESRQEQLFVDWYKYMTCAYPPENAWDSFLDVDEVKDFIEKEYFIGKENRKSLVDQINEVGEIEIKITKEEDNSVYNGEEYDDTKIIFTDIEAKGTGNAKIKASAINLAKKINKLIVKVGKHNDLLIQFIKLLKQIPDYKDKPIVAPVFSLSQKPRPRFWKPKDPVILLEGPAAESSNRYGRDGVTDSNGKGRHYCEILKNENTVLKIIANDSNLFGEKIINSQKKYKNAFTNAFNTWTDQPWNPFLLEWKVQLFPVKNEGNIRQDALDFEPNFITDNFQLRENDPDVSFKAAGGEFIGSASIYSGSSILTSHAGKEMTETLKSHIQSNVLNECLVNKSKGADNKGLGLFDDNRNSKTKDENFLDLFKNIEYTSIWYRQKRNKNIAEYKDLSLMAINALKKLREENFHSLSQSLGGFNDSLLMLKETLQLKIKDPLSFHEWVVADGKSNLLKLIKANDFVDKQLFANDNAKLMEYYTTTELEEVIPVDRKNPENNLIKLPFNFTTKVAKLVGSSSRKAPLPQNDFNPLRAGKLLITDLRFVDSFGQYIDLEISPLITSEYLEAPGSSQEVMLRPRILQPTQLHFRWMSAREERGESNDIKHNNPICGWLMPNNLDNSLMIFNADGKALGAFTESDWKPAPGTNGDLKLDTELQEWKKDTVPENLNAHLYKMMFFIRERISAEEEIIKKGKKVRKPRFLTLFRMAINSALENILPDSFAQHKSLAQLMGRPVALVRASLDIVAKAPPAIHQGWNVFQLDMNRTVRETNEFSRVPFPIRIGEHEQLNDGVVGYWMETRDGNYVSKKVPKFFSPSSDEVETKYIVTHIDPDSKESVESEEKDKWNAELRENIKPSHEGHVPVNQFQTLDDGPLKLSILFDPRGKVNLTTGLLPVKTIDIPPHLYTSAMEAMEVFFVSSPHLISRGIFQLDENDKQELIEKYALRLNLPQAPGYAWTFTKKEKIDDLEKWVEEKIEPNNPSEKLFSGEKLIKEGWLKLIKQPPKKGKK